MKIDSDRKITSRWRQDNKTTRRDQTVKVSFQSSLDEINSQQVKERFDKLLDIIEEQGSKLKKSLDERDLLEYKKTVKEFLSLIQKEFAHAKQSYSWDRTGNVRTYTIIEKVDQNLDLLHEMFLQDQADVLDIVKKIDEIRGLLIDLYI